TKFGCGIGMGGACTVHIDGRAVRSCITPLGAVANAAVPTIEGLRPHGQRPLQKGWIETPGAADRSCQSGQILRGATLLKDFRDPSDKDIDAVMSGNLCRCMAYIRIRRAIKLAAAEMRGPHGQGACRASNEAESGIPSRLPDRRGRNERSVWFPAPGLYSRRSCFDLCRRTVRANALVPPPS